MSLPAPDINDLTEAEADALFAEAFPHGLPSKGRPATGSAIVSHYPLEPTHIGALMDHAASGRTLGVSASPLQQIRHTHHKLARLLAIGTDEAIAASMCNYSTSRVAILKSDPAFIEILNFYAAQVGEVYADVVEIAKGLSLDVLNELQERLVAEPKSFTIANLTELSTKLMDRSGAGPSSTTNVNARIATVSAADLARIKAGDGSQRAPVGPPRNVTPTSPTPPALRDANPPPAVVRDPEVSTEDEVQLLLWDGPEREAEG